ncbi:hypothetical protein [Caballeronia zhejiangensis]|uniref:hypothetical protein n=1 Tax=Caballeronia zhejiangensis TaxID=871203 RepID=UPI00158939FE|nr:hypothetical protein [Caballeronia zhejiangensis]
MKHPDGEWVCVAVYGGSKEPEFSVWQKRVVSSSKNVGAAGVVVAHGPLVEQSYRVEQAPVGCHIDVYC